MFAHMQALWERVATSLWFMPSAMTLGALALAAMLLQQPLPDGISAWWLHQGTGRDAIDLMSTLLAALIPMAALLVSITMVVLTLAAGQLGPRLIRNFMSDTQTQVTLGLFMATIVYLLVVLRTLRQDMPDDDVPRLAVTVGSLLVLTSVAALMFFVHSLARSIISDTMINRVASDLDDALRLQLPDHPEPLAPDVARPPGPGTSLRVRRSGYVLTVDAERLVTRAQALGVVIELLFQPGHYLIGGSIHARAWGDSAAVGEAAAALRNALVVGGQRNAAQDLEFSIRQLVEIALRALSPGINDEFTAITAIDRLGGSLAVAVGRHSVHRVLCDGDGKARLLRPASGFGGLCSAAFNQIRQAAKGHPAVQMRLIDVLGMLLALTEEPVDRATLIHHLDLMIAQARRTVEEPYDLEVMELRARDALTRRPEAG